MIKEKCVLMFSGGLDSRLALKIMQEKGFDISALFFKLPFGTGCCDEKCSFNFSQIQGIKLEIFDCTKGKLLEEYLEIIKKAKHGTGAGVNPCIDCRIFMLKRAKEFADKKKIEKIVTGEVLGERPMSQTARALKIIEEETGLGGRLFRPLTELHGIVGRSREKQIKLAEKFKINYPTPAGGCLLCEKALKNRLNYLLERGLNEEEIKLVGIGRHFVFDNTASLCSRHENLQAGCWIVLGRDEKENKMIELSKVGEVVAPDFKGPSAVIMDDCENTQGRTPKNIQKNIFTRGKVNELIKAYSSKDLKDREKFEGERL